MAKYTELLAEYIEKGGVLPASFSSITGFEDLFKKHYCDKEIGFETELLFRMKLEEKADIYIPIYAEKITRLANAWLNYDAPAKVHYTHEYNTFGGGARKSKTTELPFDSTSADPNIINDADAYSDTNNRDNTLTETGTTIDEAQRKIEFLNKEITPLLVKLLDEFKCCFMEVY